MLIELTDKALQGMVASEALILKDGKPLSRERLVAEINVHPLCRGLGEILDREHIKAIEDAARLVNIPGYNRINQELEQASSEAIRKHQAQKERAEAIRWMQFASNDAPQATPRRHRQGAGSRHRSASRH